jgi:hypothetical protein
LILLYVIPIKSNKLYEGIWVIKRGFITLSELEKIFYLFSNSIDCKSLDNIEWDLKIVSNVFQIINDYAVENKHDLTE